MVSNVADHIQTNSRCSHTCTDKTKCLHLWYITNFLASPLSQLSRSSCREGKHRPSSKRDKISSFDNARKNAGGHDTGQAIGETTQSVRFHGHTERQIKNLERIHKRSDIQGSLKMQEGHRLKLEITGAAGQKRKTKPSFKIQFTEVEAPSNASEIIVEDTPDNDEFPSIEKLLTGDASIGATTPALESRGSAKRPDPLPQEIRKRPRISTTEKGTVSSSILVSEWRKIMRKQDGDALFFTGSAALRVPNSSKTTAFPSAKGNVTNEEWRLFAKESSSASPEASREHYNGTAGSVSQEEFEELDEWLNSGLVEMD